MCAERALRVSYALATLQVVVLHASRARAATSDILRQNAIPAAHSEGLLQEELRLPADLDATLQPAMADRLLQRLAQTEPQSAQSLFVSP